MEIGGGAMVASKAVLMTTRRLAGSQTALPRGQSFVPSKAQGSDLLEEAIALMERELGALVSSLSASRFSAELAGPVVPRSSR
jgi:hypothetical protein